jgi:hypothetical protein
LEAYAAQQIARRFKMAWDTSAATTVRMAVRDAMLAEGMTAFAEAADGSVPGSGEDGADDDAADA